VPDVAPRFNEVAAPPTFNVVAVVFKRLTVDCVDRISPPLTCRSPDNTVFALRIVVLPVVAPIVNVVAAPPKFNVVVVSLARFNDAVVPTMSPPEINKSPVITVPALRIVVLPVVAPISNEVAAPPKPSVVAVVFAILSVA